MKSSKYKNWPSLCALLALAACIISCQADTPTVSLVKQHFRISTHSEQEAQAVIAEQLLISYQKLRQCTPGEYKYAIPDPITKLASTMNKNKAPAVQLILGTYTIRGYQSDKCVFKDTYQMEGKHYSKNCAFSPDQLKSFSDQEAVMASEGKVNYDSTHPTALQQALLTSCQASTA